MNDYLGKDIQKLGFGLMRLPMKGGKPDIEQTKQMVDLFMEKGFSYFDTSYVYINGESEKAMKAALTDRYPRDSFQAATKLPAWVVKTEREAKDMFRISLERTGLDYFDFYLLHNLGGERTAVFDKFGIWEFLAEQKKAGRIKYLGFSLHAKAEHLDEILHKHPDMEFVQLQVNYADWNDAIIQSKKCCEVALKHKKPIIIMEPVKGGALSKLPKAVEDVFKKAAPNVSPVSWALRFAASLEGVITVLSGMSNVEQMKENLAVMENFEPLDAAEYAVIEEAQRELAKIPRIPCTECKYCLENCPQNVGIPGIFLAMNDYSVFNDMNRAKNKYGWEVVKAGKGRASACVQCGRCETACPQSIAIMDALGKAAKLFDA